MNEQRTTNKTKGFSRFVQKIPTEQRYNSLSKNTKKYGMHMNARTHRMHHSFAFSKPFLFPFQTFSYFR